jgi:2-keto-4-pentenoate hydratase/2-oxohepta-3-ene-1,7-dioic acid hydratase in catechol pathway
MLRAPNDRAGDDTAMKLLRYGEAGGERPGLLDAGGTLRDLSGTLADIDPGVLDDAGLDWLRALDPSALPAVPGTPRLGPPVAGIGKIVAIGLNYSDHAAEVGAKAPPEPILFMKATTALAGPNDAVPVPPGSEKLDYEVELAVVIGQRAHRVSEATALDHVAGYTVMNDVSERTWQTERKGQWVKGKSHDGFAPMGPWLVTRDEVPDPQALALWCDVDGTRRQDGTTANMIFGVAALIAAVSEFMTLMPGDVIATGTPAGVGMGMDPKGFLNAGQTLDLGVEGLGTQRQRVLAYDDWRAGTA